MIANSTGRPSRRGFLRTSGTIAAAAGLAGAVGACAPRDDGGDASGAAGEGAAAGDANPDARGYWTRSPGSSPARCPSSPGSSTPRPSASSNVMSTPMCAIDGEAVGRIRDILIDTDLLERAYA